MIDVLAMLRQFGFARRGVLLSDKKGKGGCDHAAVTAGSRQSIMPKHGFSRNQVRALADQHVAGPKDHGRGLLVLALHLADSMIGRWAPRKSLRHRLDRSSGA